MLLVPGFLGFSRFGNFYYFAERVLAAIRGSLEARLGYRVPVVPCSTLPTSPLKDRQRNLLDALRSLATRPEIGGVERFHLVGHSTGGVDAQLLTCTTNIDGGDWSDAENEVRRGIRSVVTISAPHYGTCLANSPLARLFEDPLANLDALPSAVRAVFDLALLATRQVDATGALQGGSLTEAAKFLAQLFEQRDLVTDLQPAKMQERRDRLRPDPAVPITCFATASPPRDDIHPPSDAFYKDMYGLAHDWCGKEIAAPVNEAAKVLRAVLASSPAEVIHSPHSMTLVDLFEQTDPFLNDGVVNTARQLLDPSHNEQFGGLVIADHGDVLGHYDRRDALAAGHVNAGLFHSGAGFGDDEFFTLYQRVTEAIETAIMSR